MAFQLSVCHAPAESGRPHGPWHRPVGLDDCCSQYGLVRLEPVISEVCGYRVWWSTGVPKFVLIFTAGLVILRADFSIGPLFKN